MESAEDDASSQAVTPDHDLYTIPHYSSWFNWDEIHETETTVLHEFFDGSSISRTPKIYKEYRDFIINKYREDPSRKLAFTGIRKFLIGDLSSLHKVFIFLENWGLINYSASSNHDDVNLHDNSAVVLEEGPPNGIRVVAYPNSSKPLLCRNMVSNENEFDGGDESGRLRLPPLTSYSDVFGDIPWENGLICGSCGEDCSSGYYELAKQESFLICVKCFKNENFKGTHISDNFKFHDHVDDRVGQGTDAWTDTENMLLLEAALKHGDGWNLVADHVKTKSKLACVARLIQLPFDEHMLASLDGKGDNRTSSKHMSDINLTKATSVDVQVPIKTEDQNHVDICETEQTVRDNISGIPSKSRCIISLADGGTSLMKQVALWSTVVGAPIAATAAEAAVTALCNENQYTRNILDFEEDNGTCKFESPRDEVERAAKVDDSETEERRKPSETTVTTTQKNSGPSTLQVRAEIATAIGAAAAYAKLLADLEDREIEHLMATVTDTQIKKIKYKIKHFEELELIMEKEFCQIQQLKQSILANRIDVLRRALKSGISRWKEHTVGKPLAGSIR